VAPVKVEEFADLVALVVLEEVLHALVAGVGVPVEGLHALALVGVERGVGEDVAALPTLPPLHVGEKVRVPALLVREVRERLRIRVHAAAVVLPYVLAIVVPLHEVTVTLFELAPEALLGRGELTIGQRECVRLDVAHLEIDARLLLFDLLDKALGKLVREQVLSRCCLDVTPVLLLAARADVVLDDALLAASCTGRPRGSCQTSSSSCGADR